MIFNETKLPGAFILELERFEDERGFFAQGWSAKELAAHGLEAPLAESAISFNRRKGTLRGLHYQAAPHGQVKILRCTKGSVYDVIIDQALELPQKNFERRNGRNLTQFVGSVRAQPSRGFIR